MLYRCDVVVSIRDFNFGNSPTNTATGILVDTRILFKNRTVALIIDQEIENAIERLKSAISNADYKFRQTLLPAS